MTLLRILATAFALGVAALSVQAAPLRIVIDEGVIEPLPFAVPNFIAENGGAEQYARDIARVVAADLAGTGLFREIGSDAFISGVTSFDAPVAQTGVRKFSAVNQTLQEKQVIEFWISFLLVT